MREGNVFTGVCNSIHRGVPGSTGGVPGPGGVGYPGGCLVPGGAWSCGGYLVPGGVWSGGCLMETPRTATAADGTHPTGMHSCVDICFPIDGLIGLFVSGCFLNVLLLSDVTLPYGCTKRSCLVFTVLLVMVV